MTSQTKYPRSAHWTSYGLAQGGVGLALLSHQLERCFPDAGWGSDARTLLTRGADEARERGDLSASLFGGLAGIGFTSCQLGKHSWGDGSTSATADDAVRHTADLIARVVDEQAHGVGMTFGRFDVVSGLAGIGRFLLAASVTGIAADDGLLRRLLGVLADLLMDDHDPPGWFTPAALIGAEASARMYPAGALNVGLAHGLPGPLTLLAVAAQHGVVVAGQLAALERGISWLTTHRRDDPWGPNWPAMVRLPELATATEQGARSAWCYGVPGVARALWLAGEAVGDEDAHTLAIEAMRAVYRRPVTIRNIASPTFCHGIAGLLQVTLRFRHDTVLPDFQRAATALTGQLLDAFDPDSLLGFANVEPGGGRIDHPGLLEGAPGVVLTLLAAASAAEPTWDQAFLLS